MTFWDSSALIPLLVEEPRSKACRSLRRQHSLLAVWAMTSVEIMSALQRLVRDDLLERGEFKTAWNRMERMALAWTEVVAWQAVRERAERVLGLHPLTAADSLQLAAALTLFDDRTRGRYFITADDRLAEAASREGFLVVTPGA